MLAQTLSSLMISYYIHNSRQPDTPAEPWQAFILFTSSPFNSYPTGSTELAAMTYCTTSYEIIQEDAYSLWSTIIAIVSTRRRSACRTIHHT
eukprot:scaffold54025_cov66-Cyclotella_meneghiniana.AAC.3